MLLIGVRVRVGVHVETRAVPNIRFVFVSGPNSGVNSYSVFGRIVAIGPNTNSDICFFVCGGHRLIASGGVAVGNFIINIQYALVTARSSLGIGVGCRQAFSSASWDHGLAVSCSQASPIAFTTVSAYLVHYSYSYSAE